MKRSESLSRILRIQKTIFRLGLRIQKIIVQTTIRSPWTQGQSEFWRVRARERPGGRNRGLSRFALLLLVKKDVTVVTKVQLHRRESHLPEELQVGGHYDPGTEANHGRKGRLA